MDWTADEIRVNRDLQHIQLAESQRDLPVILKKVGDSVATLFQNLPNITCAEKVVSHARSFQSHSTGEEGSTYWFRYQVLVHMRDGTPFLEEYRTETNGNVVDYARFPHAPMHASRPIATVLNFHPHIQAACRFRYFGRQDIEGRQCEVVGFAQTPDGDPTVSVLRLRNKTAGLLLQGLAWIDATSHQMLRIQTDLLAPRPDVGLEVLTTEIDFRDIQLAETPATFRLPSRVTIDLWTGGQHFRNIHEYSDFKLFRVESRIGGTP